MQLEAVLSSLESVRGPDSRGHYMACCPAHEDSTPSLSVSAGRDVPVVVHCHAGCSQDAVLAAIRQRAEGIVFVPQQSPARRSTQRKQRTYATLEDARSAALYKAPAAKVHTYVYSHDGGEVAGAVVRLDLRDGGKQFRQLAATDRGWVIGAMPEPRPLYGRCIEGSVYVVEGETCVEAIRRLRLEAVTSSGGSNAAKRSDWRRIRDCDICLIPDNDAPGERYMLDVMDCLRDLGVARVRVLRLPGLGDGGDVADWIAAGGSEAELQRLRAEAQVVVLAGDPIDPIDPVDAAERAAIEHYEAEQQARILAESLPPLPVTASNGEVMLADVKLRATLDSIASLPLRERVVRGLAAGLTIDQIPRESSNTTTPGGRRFYDESALTQIAPVTWLIDGVIPLGQMSMIVAPPSTGKSLHVLEMAYCLTHERPWRGRRVRGGGVLIYAGERLAGWNERAHAFRHRHGLPLAGRHPLAFIGGCPNLGDVAWRRHEIHLDILDWIRRYGQPPALIVIDTVSVALNGLSENDAESIAPMLRDLREIGEMFGVSWCLVHHTGKAIPGQPVTGLDAIRGSSAFAGNLDAIYLLRPDGDRVVTMAAVKLSEGERQDEVTRSQIAVGPQHRLDASGNVMVREDGSPLVSAYVEEITDEEADATQQRRTNQRREEIRAVVIEHLRQPQQMLVGVAGGQRALAQVICRGHAEYRPAEVTSEIGQLVAEGAIRDVERTLFLATAVEAARQRRQAAVADERKRAIEEAIRSTRSTSLRDIADLAGGRGVTTRAILREWEEDGVIERDASGCWILSDSPRES